MNGTMEKCPNCASPLWMTSDGLYHYRCGATYSQKNGSAQKGCERVVAATIVDESGFKGNGAGGKH